MSGYLEVKYPFKSNLGLNPFKASWKRQWCILRPSPTFSGCILAVYCSEAGASAGSIELPSGFVVRRAKSRTRPHAFAVFPANEPRKPRVLLAATTLHDAHIWMDKIKSLINGNQVLDPPPLKDCYSVTITGTELSRRCGLQSSDGTVTVVSQGILISRAHKPTVFIEWRHVRSANLPERGKCVLTVDREYRHGAGELEFCSPLAGDLEEAVRATLTRHRPSKKLSKSDGDLSTGKCTDQHIHEVRRSSWYSGPSEVSLDDLDLVMSKDFPRIREGQLSRCRGGPLASQVELKPEPASSTPTFDDSMSDRRSVASGIYEEIADVPDSVDEDNVYCKMTRDANTSILKFREEPMYEAVGECCVYATLRRRRPPPLPPRTNVCSVEGWGSVSRHRSLWSLGAPQRIDNTRSLPRWDRSRQAFTAFRKRLKSDSRTAVSPKSDASKEKDVETKKKKFDFTPTRDIFKSFKVSRKMKNLKITSTNLSKGETKSCEFLDEPEHVTTKRCSKSVECLESNDEFLDNFNSELSFEFKDNIAALSLPQEIVELILKEKILDQKYENESDYMPMSPIEPTPLEHNYIVMSPRTNTA